MKAAVVAGVLGGAAYSLFTLSAVIAHGEWNESLAQPVRRFLPVEDARTPA